MDFTLDDLRAVIREELERASGGSDVLTRAQVAELLGIEEHTVTKWVKRKGLPGVQIGRGWRFKRSEVLAWMEEKR